MAVLSNVTGHASAVELERERHRKYPPRSTRDQHNGFEHDTASFEHAGTAARLAAAPANRIRAARLEIPGGGGEKPSFFSRDSSSGETTSRPPHNNIEEDRRGAGPPVSSSSSSGDDEVDFASDLVPGGKSGAGGRRESRRRSSSVKFGAVAAILHVPGVPSPRSGSPRPASPRSGSPRSASVSFFPEPSFIHDVVNDYDDDADDEDDLGAPVGEGTAEDARR
ncbi:uncharacterized protein LOC144138022 isoform X2 [Haemaphysalis longicornis]